MATDQPVDQSQTDQEPVTMLPRMGGTRDQGAPVRISPLPLNPGCKSGLPITRMRCPTHGALLPFPRLPLFTLSQLTSGNLPAPRLALLLLLLMLTSMGCAALSLAFIRSPARKTSTKQPRRIEAAHAHADQGIGTKPRRLSTPLTGSALGRRAGSR
jgi:hypothetical protein